MLVAVNLVAMVAGFLAMVVIARRADRGLPQADRLPMQWTFGGKVTWHAPRRIALAFMPGLFAIVTLFLLLLFLFATDRAADPGSENVVPFLGVFMAGLFIAVQLLHLRLVRLTIGARDEGEYE